MINNLKNILLNEIKKEVEEYEAAKQRINEIEDRLKRLDIILNRDFFNTKRDINEEELKPPTRPSLIVKKYSFLEKYLFKRKEYISVENNNRKLQEEYQRKLEEYNLKRSEYEEEKKKLEFELNKLKELCKYNEKIRDRFEIIKNAKTIKDLNLTFEEAKSILQEHGMKFVLEECDKIITQNDSEFSKEEDFILVHKTEYYPTNNLIKSDLRSGATQINIVYFDDDEFSYEFPEARDTIHFCQNGEVSSHSAGRFDGRKYAILVPFEKVKNSNLKSFNPADTYFMGEVSTQGGYILCPEDEVEKIQEENPNTTIVGYKGKSVDGYANAFLSMLGYKFEDIGEHSWTFDTDIKKLYSFMNDNNLEYGVHSESREDFIERLLDRYYKVIGFIENLKKYQDKGYIDDIDIFIEKLLKRKNKILIKFGKTEKKEDTYFTDYAPSIMEILNNCTDTHAKNKSSSGLFLKNYIDENFIDEENDSKKSNLYFLLFKLKKDYNIDIPNENIELLLDENEMQSVELFCEKIKDNKTKQLILQMVNDKIVTSISKAKDILFLSNIIRQVYLKKEIYQEKDSENFELNR